VGRPAHLEAGLAQWRREERRRAIRRVDTYKRWLRRGSKQADIPEIPSDDDYDKWRDSRRKKETAWTP
jgi:hypothetical protein